MKREKRVLYTRTYEKSTHKYKMAGRLRSSRMNENVLDEGLKRGMVEMRDEMNGLLWKIERSRDISQEGLKSTLLKGFVAMSRVMENAVERVGERLVEEARRRDRGERVIEERVCRMEERMVDKERERKSEERRREERIQGMERTLEEGKSGERRREERIQGMERTLVEGKSGVGKREERLQMLEGRVSKEEEGGRKVRAEVTALATKVNMLIKGKEDKEMQESQYKDERMEKERAENERLSTVEEALKALEASVKGKEAEVRQERREVVSEDGRTTAEEREERERIIAEKISKIEEGLEKEKSVRMRLEEERKEEREDRVRKESIKQMECKVNDAMENVKILNLKFKKVSKVKGELLNEAERIIKGKVLDKDRNECEWILRKSKVYILGEGTEEKELGKERICTAPLLVKCGSQVERERLEGMLKSAGVRSAFHWPREMLEFVDEVRGWVEDMGYRKDEYFIKVRPFKVEGVPQLRAEVKRKDGKGGGFRKVSNWSCPPLNRNLW